MLCQVDALLAALGDAPSKSAPSAEASCGPEFSMSRLPEYVARGGSRGMDLDLIEADADGYYQSRAYADMNPEECRPLAALQRAVAAVQKTGRIGIDWDPHCRGTYAEMRFVHAIVVRDGVREACVETLKSGRDNYGRGDPKSFDRVCLAISENLDDPGSACAFVPQNGKECRNIFRVAGGEAAACDKVEEGERDGCYGYAAFARAYKRKDPELCLKNEMCRTLLGDGTAAARRYERRIFVDVGRVLLKTAAQALAACTSSDPAQTRALRERTDRVTRFLTSAKNERVKKGGPPAREPFIFRTSTR